MASHGARLYEDRSSTIEIATYALSGTFLVFYIARQVMKAIVFRKVALDDLLILLATACAIGLSATTLFLTSRGFGVSGVLTISRADTIMKGHYASELLYVTAICFSKLSIVVLFYNVVILRTHRISIFIFGICILAWSLASFAAAAFQCSLPRPWEMMTLRCFNTRIFWTVYCAIDVSTELSIVMLSVDLVAHLRVRMSRKLAVIACFAPRLFVVAAAVVRATYLYQVTPHGNPGYELWITTVCTQVHICASICTACIPYMVPFFKGLQGNIWRSYSTRSWIVRPRSNHPLGQSPHRLRKRGTNSHFEVPRSVTSFVKEPERVSRISPRIPSPGPISPLLPPHTSTLQTLHIAPNMLESQEARTLSVAGTMYDRDSNETFDIVCFAPPPVEPPVQARLSSAASLDVLEPYEYFASLSSSDQRSSSSYYSSRASTPTRSETNPRFSLFHQGTHSYTPLQSTSRHSSPRRNYSQSQYMTVDGEANRVLSRQTLFSPATSYDYDDFAHPARSKSSRSLPKFSTTPRLHTSPTTISPAAPLNHSACDPLHTSSGSKHSIASRST